MPLPVPKLDDRSFQELVDEAKKRIPHYTQEWTDHNVSDPGITLVELFAWMTDVLLYRLNQVPELHYVRFLEMLGITLKPPQPAQVAVTFWLSAPHEATVFIPEGTEVASTQTETQPSIIFTTDQEFPIHVPDFQKCLSRVTGRSAGNKAYREHNLRRLQAGFDGVEVFTSTPQIDDALYFGFGNDLSGHVIRLDFDFDPAGGAGIDPTLPPYIWEAATGKDDLRWKACYVETDTTRGMNVAGRIQVHLPEMGRYQVADEEIFWVRVRLKEISATEKQQGMQPYDRSPKIKQVGVVSIGGKVQATHTQTVRAEFLGQSDGTPGQRFSLQRTPVLARKPDEHLLVQPDAEKEQVWTEVRDFATSSSEDRHYILNSLDGEVRFGPAIRQPDGTIKLYGAIPQRGANLVFSRYRSGGGQEGNIQPGVLNTLKTAIPYIGRVSNLEPAWGGLDAESLEDAKTRAPAELRSRQRAVTEADYEHLALQALPSIGRVKCLQPQPSNAGGVIAGQIYVLVIARAPQPEEYLEVDELSLSDEDMDTLKDFLDERRQLTSRLDIRPPAFIRAAVRVQLRAAPDVLQEDVRAQVLKRLYRFLNPLVGGPEGSGWPFGRELFISDVYQCLQGIPGIQFVRSVEMYAARQDGEATGEARESIEVTAHGVVVSGKHEVRFI